MWKRNPTKVLRLPRPALHRLYTRHLLIGDITGVIDSIAFQSNILALNAAVEAARAGEQGRGFAVVAAEVGMLAQRSGEASREIRQLIRNSVGQVEQGRTMVGTTGSAMQGILGQVEAVSHTIEAIHRATSAQSSDVQSIRRAVVEVDDMTQRNAALVEQSASAAEGMRRQSERLLGLVSAFKLDRAQTEGIG